MELYIDFGGFYGYHETYIEDEIDKLGYNDYDNDLEKVDYPQTFDNYAKAWVDKFNNKYDMNLEFITIDSPRFYNHRTDKIVVKAYQGDIDEILSDIHNSYFIEFIDERLASRSGFASFYDDGKISPYDNIIGKAFRAEREALSHLLELYIEWMLIDQDFDHDIHELEYEISELKQ